jgi:hypothetical protein
MQANFFSTYFVFCYILVTQGEVLSNSNEAYVPFFVGVWSWLADKLHFILSYEAGFYKPTVLKVHPPFCRITAYATMPG